MRLNEDQIAALEDIVAEFAEDFEQWVKPAMEGADEIDAIASKEQRIRDARKALDIIRRSMQ